MPGFRAHPLDRPLESMVKAMQDADTEIGHMTSNIRDFDSKELTPQEDELVFHNPSLRYLGQVDPTSGMPFTNAQAAQKLLQDIGPAQYVAYVEDFVQRSDRRAASVPSDSTSSVPAPMNPEPEMRKGPLTASHADSRSWVGGGGGNAGSGGSGGGGGPIAGGGGGSVSPPPPPPPPPAGEGTIGGGTVGGGTVGNSNA